MLRVPPDANAGSDPEEGSVKLNMVVASSEAVACRVFIGCTDLANEFGVWLQANGWVVRIEADVEPAAQPRLKEEEEMAAVLTGAFEKWKITSTMQS
jgi:hypothetical protein